VSRLTGPREFFAASGSSAAAKTWNPALREIALRADEVIE